MARDPCDKSIYGREWGDSCQYELMINSSIGAGEGVKGARGFTLPEDGSDQRLIS